MANPARFTAAANLGRVTIPTTSAQVKSNGVSAGNGGTDSMYKVFTAGTYDSYLEKIRFMSVASAAATTGVATVLRAYVSTVADPTAASGTTAANTFLLGEISVGPINSSNSTNMAAFFDMPIDMVIPTGSCVHVSQHVAQNTNQNWIALAIGGDYAAA